MSTPRKITTQTIAITGLMSATGLVLLYLASVIPSGWMGVTAVAGLAVAVAVSSAGTVSGILTYIVSGLLSLLLIPAKQLALLFICLFGLYPLLKLKLERFKARIVEYLLKLAFFNVVLIALYFAANALLFAGVEWSDSIPMLPVLIVAGSVIFLLYDFAFSKVMSMLQARLIPQLRRRFGGH